MSDNRHLLTPLDTFYDPANAPLPEAVFLDPEQVPEPYRRLLCHNSDMTPTLEEAYGETIHLHVLDYSLRDRVVSRRVVLVLEDNETPVEMGAIEIHLEPLPAPARAEIRERHKPFGAILRDYEIPHSSRPTAFFRITPDGMIRSALQVKAAKSLYGRQNILRAANGQTLARVVEILPATNPFED